MAQELTTQQIENIMIDTGVVYVNYGEVSEAILAPTRGGSSFVVEQDVRVIERDGALGKEKGLRRVVTENAMLTVRLMDFSAENLKKALAGSVLASSKVTGTLDGSIADAEYLTNVALVGTTLGGDNVVIKLYNAMADGGLTIDTTDKDESVFEVVFAGHRDPTDYTVALYDIEIVTP